MKKTYKFFLSGFGSGFLPVAPGTWGAAVAVLMAWPLQYIDNQLIVTLILSLTTIVFLWIGVRGSQLMEAEWGKDPSQTVIDEMIGVWIALLGFSITVPHLLAAFVLFRFFDIAKPLGVRSLEKIGDGWGVMLDDALAGVYANITLQVLVLAFNF